MNAFGHKLFIFFSLFFTGARIQTQVPSQNLGWTWTKDGWEIHMKEEASPSSKTKAQIPLLRFEGVRLHQVLSDGSVRETLIPLRAQKLDKKSLFFEGEIPREHRFILHFDRKAQGKGSKHPILSFRFRDEIGIQTKASRITLLFRWIRSGPLPRIEQTFPSTDGNLFPEKAFAAPFLLLGDQRGSLALTPKIGNLREKRRLPLVLSSEKKKGVLLEFGFGQTGVLSGQVIETPERTFPLREEDLEVQGQLHFFPDSAPEEAFQPLLSTIWKEGQKKTGLGLLGKSWRSLRTETTIGLLHRLDHQVKGWQKGTSLIHDLTAPQGPLMIAAHLLETLRKNSKGSPLNQAQQALAWQRIGDTLSLLRWVPKKGGLFRTHFSGNPKKSENWLLRDKEPFSTEACSRVGLILWSILPLLQAEQAREVRALCERLARFLMENQTPRGSIASFFREDLSPIRNAFIEDAAGTLACGRFLLAYGKKENSKAVKAAASLMKAFESRHRTPPIPDPKLRFLAPQSFPSPLRSQTALDALALSLGLAKTKEGHSFSANARIWLLELSKLQISAATPSLLDRSRGAFLQSNLALDINNDFGEVGSILIDAAETLQLPTALSRARAAIRFLLTRKPGPSQIPGSKGLQLSPQLLRDLEKIEQTHGSLILDRTGQAWCATENYGLSLFSNPKEGARRAVIRAAPSIRGDHSAEQWGSFVGEDPSKRSWLLQGGKIQEQGEHAKIQIRPRALEILSYEPAQEVDRRFDLPVSATILDVSAPPSKAWLSFGPAIGPMAMLPLAIQIQGNNVLLSTRIPQAFLPQSKTLLTQVHAIINGREITSPENHGALTILGDSFFFDFNEAGALHRLGLAMDRVPLSHGMGMGVPLGTASGISFQLPIPASALRLRLQLRIQGNIQIKAGKHWTRRIAVSEGFPYVDKTFTLFDREDWGKGEGLSLQIRGLKPASALLQLRYSHEGNGSPISQFEKKVSPPKPAPSQAQALIIPISLGGGFSPTSEELSLSFFGPESSSSLHAWIAKITQSKINLSGQVLPWRSLPPEKNLNIRQIARAALRLHRNRLSQIPSPNLLFLPIRAGKKHVFQSTWLPPSEVALLAPFFQGKKAPALFLFPLAKNGISLGLPASLLLQFWSGLPAGDQGLAAFGPRFPGRSPAPPGRPTNPAGLSLHEAGFGTVYLAPAHSLPEIRLPPLSQGGFLLELPIPLPARERVFIEARGPSLLLPPRLAQGELIAIRDTRIAPKQMDKTGHPSFLSLIHSTPTRERDPASTADTLGYSIHTLDGEEIWNIQPKSFDEDGTQIFALKFMGTDLSPKKFPRFLREPESRLFHAVPAGDSRLPNKRGGILLLKGPTLLGPKEQRLFLQGEVTCLSKMRVIVEGKQVFEGRIAPGLVRLLLTLPPHDQSRRFRIEIETLQEGKHSFVLDQARTFPLFDSIFQARNVTPRNLYRNSFAVPFSDGSFHSPTLLFPKNQSNQAAIPLPVSIPPEGGILRVRAAIPNNRTSAPRPLFRVLFRSTDGAKRKVLIPWTPLAKKGDPIPLFRINLSPLRKQTGFLILERKGSKAPVHILECSIRRG